MRNVTPEQVAMAEQHRRCQSPPHRVARRSSWDGRHMALLGLIGGPLVTASGIAILFGLYEQVSPVAAITAIPETLWEASLGIWLIVKGFNPSVSASEKFRLRSDDHSPETRGVAPVPAP